MMQLSEEDRKKLDEIRKKAEAALREQMAGSAPLLGSLMAARLYGQLVGQPAAAVELELLNHTLDGQLIESVWYVNLLKIPESNWALLETNYEHELKNRLSPDDEMRVEVERAIADHRRRQRFIIVTTPMIPNRPASQALGTVSGDAVLGHNSLADVMHGLVDAVAGRSATLTRYMQDARATCLDIMRDQALAMGAEAVVGLRFQMSEYEVKGIGMLLLSATGTAIVCKA